MAILAALAAFTAPQARGDTGGPLLPLVDAAAERLQIAEPVAAVKWRAHAAIEDPDRVEHELATLRDEATAQGIDPDYVVAVFNDQISATEAIEYARFAEWKLDPAGVPATAEDLTASRTAIDHLNAKILSHISLNWSLLHSPSCERELSHASTATVGTRHFDDLYQRALRTATRSYCQAAPAA